MYINIKYKASVKQLVLRFTVNSTFEPGCDQVLTKNTCYMGRIPLVKLFLRKQILIHIILL